MSEQEKVNEGQRQPDLLTEKMIGTRTIIISGEINEQLAKEVCTQLLLLESINNEPINLFISSNGGHVDSGYLIFDMINFIEPKVNIIGSGWVVSAGALIYLSSEKDRRYCLPNTRFMIHEPSGGTQGQSSDMEITAKEIIRTREKINQLIAKETGKDIEQVKKDTARDYWLSAEEALDYGIVHKIIKHRSEIV
ncbi:ATP-dependent Clp protease proteolytic subunit [Enterococcus caccae]|uniref:ATP-dependent Clp protease proteolytic subunit n=1 Tax=Enterococcus caccae ATCC BAA-1240 TaxID=1158612 RepID=R3X9E6_9ENTE|nr:ATP-dependent Clp protease proteolytic subunit [Enterococcus caccae]EOL50705.1 ATP-dependent Clp endopeptidase, proteolytic subunit ClpP [Enterococcus caccae ATCC BAA-1240]EOT59402.1 ATP-dependent Clp endopeptidase, proteolytic subunit ClpP [Enterococcus caccae ATCC BAA-1240]OJG27689.1 ATP-dependent Clp endopeptidase, proteolytic subunit ClpP [Enterococcus caccae]